MIFEPTTVHGVVLIRPERLPDERGYFARTWAQDEFTANGLNSRVVQRNLSHNPRAGTLRGMHYQRAPYAEAKLVSCIAGAMYDVALDIRADSPTCGKWFGVVLRADDGNMLYIPEGCAHGLLTLEPNTTVEYLMSEFFHPESATGVRWDDPSFGVLWPKQPRVMSPRDRAWPDFVPAT